MILTPLFRPARAFLSSVLISLPNLGEASSLDNASLFLLLIACSLGWLPIGSVSSLLPASSLVSSSCSSLDPANPEESSLDISSLSVPEKR